MAIAPVALLAGPAIADDISGVVIRAQSGQPVTGAPVIVFDDANAPVARATTGPDGRFAVRDLPAGSYRVVIYSTRTGARIAQEALTLGGPHGAQVSLAVGARKTRWGQTVGTRLL
jgi:hypothetical protein